ncbi:MAG TPA: NHL repeat-containing protein, partial [Acidimicrobiales bacterium]|nr:NHL repeat-containing protein [Acidimicrobiales bacterium]
MIGTLVAGMLATSAGAAVPAAGSLTTFAGGLGHGAATNVGQSPVGVGLVGDRVLEVDGPTTAPELPPPGAWYATVVRAIDPTTGVESVVAGNDAGGFDGDGGPAVGAPLGPTKTVVGDAAGNVYISEPTLSRVRKVSPAGIITTLAGSGTAGFSGDGGPATAAALNEPEGIAVAPDGAIVVADTANGRVRRIGADGRISTIAGNGTGGTAGDGGPALSAGVSPFGIAFDAGGTLYISDLAAGTIRAVLPAGTVETLARTPNPFGLTVTPAGRVLFTNGNTIESVDAKGVVSTVAGTNSLPGGFSGDGGPATSAILNSPRGVVVDKAGNLYIADSNNKRVRRVDPTGVIITIAGNGTVDYGGDGAQATAAQLLSPYFVRTGPTGTFIADLGNGTVRFVDKSGVIRTVRRSMPQGMVVDGAGNLYLSEGRHVVKLAPDGTVTVVAGRDGSTGSTGDGGPATDAGLSGPAALALDGSGNLYIDDEVLGSGYAFIRRVDAAGVITTIAGVVPDGRDILYPAAALQSVLRPIMDMAVGADGALYVLDKYNILRIAGATISNASPRLAYVRQMSAFVLDRAGNVFVTDGQKIERDAPNGTSTLVAGAGTAPVTDGVQATAAKLDPGFGLLALDDAGNLYFTKVYRVLEVAGVSPGSATPGAPCDAANACPPHWGRYKWDGGATTADIRAFWLFDRTGDARMHGVIKAVTDAWNSVRGAHPELPFIGVVVDDANVGACFLNGTAGYSVASACMVPPSVTGAGPTIEVANACAAGHLVGAAFAVTPGLSTDDAITAVCHTVGQLLGLRASSDPTSCMST